MNIASLSGILKIFSGGDPTAEEKQRLYNEALLMTLSRASSSDANINPCEVETVQTILREVTGDDFSVADIRVAAASELYERAPLDKYLGSVAGSLTAENRVTIARSLANVINSDAKVTSREIEFFDMVAKALKLTPAELVGLTAE